MFKHHLILKFLLTNVIVGIALFANKTNAQVTFTNRYFTIPIGASNAYNLSVSDFNNDGYSDLAMANFGSDNVSVFLGKGGGYFESPVNYAVGIRPVGIEATDLNGDGNIDLTILNNGTDNVSILLGNGNGTFGTSQNFAVGSSPISLSISDFNGDGKKDLVIANSLGNNVSVFLGLGTGAFEFKANYPVGSFPRSVASGDLNSDGYNDIVVVNYGSDNLSVLLGTETGSFASAVNYGVGSTPTNVKLGDLNLDGINDLIVANSSSSDISVLLGLGNGVFQSAINYAVNASPSSVEFGDFNGDNILDLVSSSIGSNSISILLGKDTGDFMSAIDYTIQAPSFNIKCNDINEDGKNDLIITNFNDSENYITLMLNTTPFDIIVKSASISGLGGKNTISTSGGTLQFTSSYSPTYANTNTVVSWSVSPTSIASISGSGLLQALSNGIATVTGRFGTISGVQLVNISGQVLPTTTVVPRFGIQPRTIFCGSGTSFCVPISTNVPISPYVVGLDFELYYDQNYITPTGQATLGSVSTSYGNYSLNTSIPGKVVVSLFLDNPPINTYMSGSGVVICIGFTVKNTVQPGQTLSVFSSSPILQSGYLDASTVPSILPGAYTFSRPLIGAINYQGTNTRLTGATGQNTTTIQGFDFTTTSTVGSALALDAQGRFQVLDLGTGNIKIGRDVAGDVTVPSASCANVLPVINSTDRLLATQISNGIVATPTIYQLLAADVNLDGKVSAGDATLISMRSVNAFNCEFPQLWNYQLDATGNLVPKPTYTKSIDWVFLDRSVLTTPGFVGATKSNIPSIAPFIALNTNRNTPCNGLIDQTIAGILLGDVNANWTTTNGATLRTEEIQNTVVINLDSIQYLSDGTIEIPFTYESNDSLTGIDFSLNYDTLTLGVKSIGVASDLNSSYGLVYNNIKSIGRLMVSSYIKQNPLVLNRSVLVLKLNKYVGPLVASSFSNISAYYNGDPANVRVDGGAAITSYQEELFKNLRLHPNPTTGIVHVNFASSNATYELSTVLGAPIQSGNLNGEINLSDVHAGVYTLSITLDGVKKNYKIIKQ